MNNILTGEKIKKYFTNSGISVLNKKTIIKSVDCADISIPEGYTAGLVGESGCGKSTLGKCLIKLIEPDAGTIKYRNKDITALKGKDFKDYRRKLQIIFQDPYSTLNPRRTIGGILNEIIKFNKSFLRDEGENLAERTLEMVGLKKSSLIRYPHEFSGGQRQRIAIAKALVCNPELIVCDEPVSALDVSVQSQILNLLKEIQKKFKLSLLFISHDLPSVRHMSHIVYVMYLGEIVEKAFTDDLFDNPKHPYTLALLSATPVISPTTKTKKIILKGDIPSNTAEVKGCRYYNRCHLAENKCRSEKPPIKKMNGHEYRCWL